MPGLEFYSLHRSLDTQPTGKVSSPLSKEISSSSVVVGAGRVKPKESIRIEHSPRARGRGFESLLLNGPLRFR